MQAALSVIIPTLGRDTLQAALDSLVLKITTLDEVIVVADDEGDMATAREIADLYDVIFYSCPPNEYGQGYAQRNLGMELATGSHLCFLDDDDIYTWDALDLFREAACEAPVIFRMFHHEMGVLWKDKELRFGNVGTPMFLVPNDLEKMGEWHPHQEVRWGKSAGGDFTFITGCVEKMGPPVWREEIVSVVRPYAEAA